MKTIRHLFYPEFEVTSKTIRYYILSQVKYRKKDDVYQLLVLAGK